MEQTRMCTWSGMIAYVYVVWCNLEVFPSRSQAMLWYSFSTPIVLPMVCPAVTHTSFSPHEDSTIEDIFIIQDWNSFLEIKCTVIQIMPGKQYTHN